MQAPRPRKLGHCFFHGHVSTAHRINLTACTVVFAGLTMSDPLSAPAEGSLSMSAVLDSMAESSGTQARRFLVRHPRAEEVCTRDTAMKKLPYIQCVYSVVGASIFNV